MKILLLGEYSNLHWTLAEGLRTLGHDVTVASDGDGFKNNRRDIDLLRKSSDLSDTIDAIKNLYKNLDNFKGYDVVQLINPCFTTSNTRINNYLYDFLRKNNDRIFLGAFGDDAYWLEACLNKDTFRYSEFYVNGKENFFSNNTYLKKIWAKGTPREKLNTKIADTCDGIISCLYEYYISYKSHYNDKLTYIPLPINLEKIRKTEIGLDEKINFFVGINKSRTHIKGTDRLYNTLLSVQSKYKDVVSISKVESIAYLDYVKSIEKSDVVLDQLYSYSPAMNGLLTLALGKVLVSGAEPEMYDLLGEKENRPIVNVIPSEDDIFTKLENIILNSPDLPEISNKGRAFVEKYHDHIKVARQYLDFWAR